MGEYLWRGVGWGEGGCLVFQEEFAAEVVGQVDHVAAEKLWLRRVCGVLLLFDWRPGFWNKYASMQWGQPPSGASALSSFSMVSVSISASLSSSSIQQRKVSLPP